MAPTKQQWEKIQDELSLPYGQAFFRCDGYLIHAYVQQSKMKLVIAIYTNGVMSGKHQWTGKESQISQMNEVSRRFWCWHKKAPSAREKKQNERIFGKRKCQERRINEGFIYTVPYFNSASAFIRHIKKHNEQIEVLSLDEYHATRDQQREMECDATE